MESHTTVIKSGPDYRIRKSEQRDGGWNDIRDHHTDNRLTSIRSRTHEWDLDDLVLGVRKYSQNHYSWRTTKNTPRSYRFPSRFFF